MNRMNLASSLMSLSLLLAGSSAFAADEMKKDEMAKDCAKDAMSKG